MCDVLDTLGCPIVLILLSDPFMCSSLEQYLRDNFVHFDTITCFGAMRAVCLFSTSNEQDCVNFLKRHSPNQTNCDNGFHVFHLKDIFYPAKPEQMECDSTT